jgi:hypothetical protein
MLGNGRWDLIRRLKGLIQKMNDTRFGISTRRHDQGKLEYQMIDVGLIR